MSGEAIYKTVGGEGPDLVLIHGWGLHGGIWQEITPHLNRSYRTHAVDLPGHGRSPLPEEPYTLELLAERVTQSVPDGAIWVGWSLGGLVTLQALLNDAAIDKLVLVGCQPRFQQGEEWPNAIAAEVLEGFATSLRDDYRTTLWRFLTLQCQGSERAQQELRTLRKGLFAHGEPDPVALMGGVKILQRSNLIDSLQGITTPTLLLNGDRDTLSPIAGARRTSQLIPGAKLITIKGAAHAPFISHPEIFLSLLRQFIDGESAS